jgi:hypothetical protein
LSEELANYGERHRKTQKVKWGQSAGVKISWSCACFSTLFSVERDGRQANDRIQPWALDPVNADWGSGCPGGYSMQGKWRIGASIRIPGISHSLKKKNIERRILSFDAIACNYPRALKSAPHRPDIANNFKNRMKGHRSATATFPLTVAPTNTLLERPGLISFETSKQRSIVILRRPRQAQAKALLVDCPDLRVHSVVQYNDQGQLTPIPADRRLRFCRSRSPQCRHTLRYCFDQPSRTGICRPR